MEAKGEIKGLQPAVAVGDAAMGHPETGKMLPVPRPAVVARELMEGVMEAVGGLPGRQVFLDHLPAVAVAADTKSLLLRAMPEEQGQQARLY